MATSKMPARKTKGEFSPTKTSKPGAVQKAQKLDTQQDQRVAKRFGVKLNKGR